MLTTTDVAVFVLLLFFLLHGWHIGFLRSILSPVCFFFSIMIAIINFDLNTNPIIALLIVILGTLIVSTIIRMLIFLARRTVDEESRKYVFWGSRLLGSAASVCWRGSVTAVLLLALSILPTSSSSIADMQKDITKSRTYFAIQEYGLTQFPTAKNIFLALSIFKDPAKTRQLSQMPEFQAFFANPKVKELLSDPAFTLALNGKNINGLISNPKLNAVLDDRYLMIILTRLSERLYRANAFLDNPNKPSGP